MIYSKIKAGVWVKYEEDAETGTLLFRRKLVERKQAIRERIQMLPEYPDDAELLEWAKKNYPVMNVNVEKNSLQNELDAINLDLDSMVE